MFSSPIVTGGLPAPGSETVVVVVAVVVVVVVAVVVTVVVPGTAAVAGCDPAPQAARPRAAHEHTSADPTEPMNLAPGDITSDSHTPAARRASACASASSVSSSSSSGCSRESAVSISQSANQAFFGSSGPWRYVPITLPRRTPS